MQAELTEDRGLPLSLLYVEWRVVFVLLSFSKTEPTDFCFAQPISGCQTVFPELRVLFPMSQKGFAERVAARMKQLGYCAQAITKILKPLSKGPAAHGKAFSHVTPVEEELMKHMHADGLGVKRIAAAVRRSTDTVSKHLFRKCGQTPGKVGPKVCITEAKYKQIYKGYQRLLQKSRAKEVHCQDGEERLEAQVQCQNFEPRILGAWGPLPAVV